MFRSRFATPVGFATTLALATLVGCSAPTGECRRDADCPPGEVCQSGECVQDDDDGPTPTGETLTLDLGGGVSMELVRISAGTFRMGSENGSTDETPVHSVTISRDFYVGRYEVTQTQWRAVMVDNPSHFEGCDSCPVEMLSWEDAVGFCNALSGNTGYGIRLPSEAEWECACRAGTITKYSFGDDADELGNYAWHPGNSSSQTHEVGTKLPNAWGLHDMHGNVWEWCNDWYGTTYYRDSSSSDPQGPSSGTSRVVRGGSCINDCDDYHRSAGRSKSEPDDRGETSGFRVAAGTEQN